MKRANRILLGAGCLLLLVLSWVIAATAQTDTQRQLELMEQADAFLQDEVYVRAIPLLEEAAGYQNQYTLQAEQTLKQAYLHMLHQTAYPRKYTSLLDKQMARSDATPQVFQEAAEYYLSIAKYAEAFSVLTDGIERTGDEQLRALYEANRYLYKMGRATYQDVTTTSKGAIQVCLDGRWGLANSAGELVIPCEYDWISTFYEDRAVAQKGDVVTAVDRENNRLALFHGQALELGNYGDFRMAIKTSEGWQRTDSELNLGSMTFEAIGMYADGCAPAQVNGRWGVIGTGNEWLIEPSYDGIVQDELGRCGLQDALFVIQNGQAQLFVKKMPVEGAVFEDARPFFGGWAAVKRDGKWGFLDTEGTVQIDFQFDDARSFGQHLAAVKLGDYWGYVSLSGDVVIEPVFYDAKSFYSGSAPVLDSDGWRFITLLEYKN